MAGRVRRVGATTAGQRRRPRSAVLGACRGAPDPARRLAGRPGTGVGGGARAGPGGCPQARRRRPLRPPRRWSGGPGGGQRPRRRRPSRRVPATRRPRSVVGGLGAEVALSGGGPRGRRRATAGGSRPARAPCPGRRILRVRRRPAVPGARAGRSAGGPAHRRGPHRRGGRTPPRRRGGRGPDPPRARRPRPRPRARARGHGPAQPHPGEGPARRGGGVGAQHPQVGPRAVPRRPTRWSTPSWSGARTSGSRRPTATAGWTSTSAPTGGCAAAGPRATARPAG